MENSNRTSIRGYDLGSQFVKKDDVIAFDPGDISKEYAKKMAYLYPVHDGSKGCNGLGYEYFGVEAIQWMDGKKMHFPLYHHLTNASCDNYMSQNVQILKAIEIVLSNIPKGCGIWTFDRGHDRTILYKEAFLKKIFTWIVRLKKNRNLIPLDPVDIAFDKKGIALNVLREKVKLSRYPSRLLFPKESGDLHIGWIRVCFPFDKKQTPLPLVVVKDPQNAEPVIFLTNKEVRTMADALVAFGYYLEPWGKEEGYRFCQSFLNLEDMRALKWPSIPNLFLIVNLVCLFGALTYRKHGSLMESMAEEKLQNFKSINKIKYKYYRMAHLYRCFYLNKEGLIAG